MIEVKDEILGGAPRYRIRDENNNILFDNLTIEMITQILQQGTPLNKLLFDSLQEWLSNVTNNTEMYFTPTLTHFETHNLLTNSYPIEPYVMGRKIGVYIPNTFSDELSTPVTPIMNANEKDGYTIATTYSNGYMALDRNASTSATKSVSNSDEINYFMLKMPKAIVTGISITYSSFPQGTVYGSLDDGSTWEQIGTMTSSKTSSTATFSIANKEYTSIKIVTTGKYSSSYNTLTLTEINISGYKLIFDIGLPTYLNLNDLGNVLIDEKIEAGKHYTLAYIDNKFKSVYIPNIVLNNNYISITTGTISHGAVIPKTSGFEHYIYFVSPCTGNATYDYSPYNNCASGTGINCNVNQSTRVVTAQVSTYSNRENMGDPKTTTANGTANYLEIAWR